MDKSRGSPPDSSSKADPTSVSKEDSRWLKIEIPSAGAPRGSSFISRRTTPIAVGAEVASSTIGPGKRRLDAAVPSSVTVHVPFPLLVQVRFPDSSTITIEDFPNVEGQIEITKEVFSFDSGQLLIDIEAPNCIFWGERKKKIYVPNGEFSPMLRFLLTPNSVGTQHIQVTARSTNDDLKGEVIVLTRVQTVVTDRSIQVVRRPISMPDQSPPVDLTRINELMTELNLQLRLKHDYQMQAVGIRKIEVEQEIKRMILPKITALDTELAVLLSGACQKLVLEDGQSAQFVKELATGVNKLESTLASRPSLPLQRSLGDLLTILGNYEMDANAQLALAIPSIPEMLGFESEYPALIHLRASWDRIRQFLIFQINQPRG